MLAWLLGVALLRPAQADDLLTDIAKYRAVMQTVPLNAQVDQKDGFRDLKFGQKCSTTPRFLPAREVGNISVWIRVEDEYEVGNSPLNGIAYLCKADKLRAVILLAPTSSAPSLGLALQTLYGPPGLKEDNFVYWRGQRRAAWVAGDSRQMVVCLGDLPLADPAGMVEGVLRAAGQAAAKDL